MLDYPREQSRLGYLDARAFGDRRCHKRLLACVSVAALAAVLVGAVAFLVSVLTLIEKARMLRRHDDRRIALLEAQHAALERIAVAIEHLPR